MLSIHLCMNCILFTHSAYNETVHFERIYWCMYLCCCFINVCHSTGITCVISQSHYSNFNWAPPAFEPQSTCHSTPLKRPLPGGPPYTLESIISNHSCGKGHISYLHDMFLFLFLLNHVNVSLIHGRLTFLLYINQHKVFVHCDCLLYSHKILFQRCLMSYLVISFSM